jgi:hypothetical protein
MKFRPLTVAAALWTLALPAGAAPLDDLWAALRIDDQIDLVRQEGIAAGAEIAEGLFPGGVPQGWTDAVARIYDTDRLTTDLRQALEAGFIDTDPAPVIGFFTTAPGVDLLSLEISTRLAMLDADIEAAANEAAAVALGDDTPRAQLVSRFVAANDIVETNVISAMNSQIAFFGGLAAGGGMQGDLTEDQIIDEVMNRAPEIRASTTEWVFAFLLMAYGPATDADIEAYIAFSETDAGQAWNRATFTAFDQVFNAISGELGAAAAGFMATQEL